MTWHGKRDVRVTEVADPVIREPTDAVVRVTSTAICGSDLHLYEILTMFMSQGDILGHEAMGIVEEVGPAVEHVAPGDRVVVPFNISCGTCFMCQRGLQSQCETTQVREEDKGARLFGYTRLYGSVPGGQAEYVRVPQAHYGLIPVGKEHPDDRYLYLSDVLPTAWQALAYADVPEGGSLAVFGLGPIGQFCVRLAPHLGVGRVMGVDLVPERLALATAYGADAIDLTQVTDLGHELRMRTDGRGPDAVIDAVGMEAHGSPVASSLQKSAGLLPDAVAAALIDKVGVDRLQALHDSIGSVRRGGTVSIVGVYGGAVDPMPMMQLFDRQIQLRMGQANVKRWIDDLLPLVEQEGDPLGTETFATHHLPLDAAPDAYAMFQKKEDGAVKVVLQP